MYDIVSLLSGYYYFILIIQALCVWHSIRKGNQQKWIWIIVFLPLIGCIAYIFTEIIKKRDLNNLQANVSTIVNPVGRIKDLEKQYKFSDTFTNLVRLGDAYLYNKEYDKAIALYEKGLSGTFSDNEQVMKQMIVGYYHLQRYEDAVRMGQRIKNDPNFSKSESNLFYAYSLENIGRTDLAEKEYQNMNHRFSNFEQRYRYGEFLIRMNRKSEALNLYGNIATEAEQMNRREKGQGKMWIDKAVEIYQKG